jgi:hypothetical protein
MSKVIREHPGNMYLLACSWEREAAGQALMFHHLAPDWPACAKLKPHVDTANDGELLFCAVRRAIQ